MLEDLDSELRSLLSEHVDSYEKLDVVLFVHGRGQPVHLREVAHSLRLAASQVERTVAALCASGLLMRHAGELVGEPARESMRRGLDALASAYSARPLAVLSALSRKAVMRQRTRARRPSARRGRRHAIR